MKALYLAHSLHSGLSLKYDYAPTVDQSLFDELPFTYGISNVKVDGLNREVLATIIVKTDLGQSIAEIGLIYSKVAAQIADFGSLPTVDVTVRCTKVNLPAGTVPSEDQLLQMLKDVYAVNGVGGCA